jgi:YfiH family protein
VAIAIAHAGWRGLAAGLIEATVARMAVPAAGVIAWLGPAIGPQAYEVGPEVRAAFLRADPAAAAAFAPHRDDRLLADLCLLARQRLARAGVGAVHGGAHCTYIEAERFYSYRRQPATGRFASLVWID